MRRRVKLPIEIPGGLPTAAGITDPVTYRAVKAILDALHNLKVDINPQDTRKIAETPLALNEPAMSLVQEKIGTGPGLYSDTTDNIGEDLVELGGVISPSGGISSGSGTIIVKPAPIRVYNTYGSSIPAYSAMEITSISSNVAQVTRPTTADLQPGQILFTKGTAIASGTYGQGYSAFDGEIEADRDSAGSAGDEFGTQANSFELLKGNSGFVANGEGSNGVRVRPFRSIVPEYTGELKQIWEFSGGLGHQQWKTYWTLPSAPGMPTWYATDAKRGWFNYLYVGSPPYMLFTWQNHDGTWWQSVQLEGLPADVNHVEVTNVTFDVDGCPQGSGGPIDFPFMSLPRDATFEFGQNIY